MRQLKFGYDWVDYTSFGIMAVLMTVLIYNFF